MIKIKSMRLGGVLAAGVGLMLVSGCVVEPRGRVVVAAPGPVVVAPAPPPEPVYIPDDYVWDGYEYVGVVGTDYFYLGPGNIWIRCEPFRLERFHGWERYHHDWRVHAIRNDRYRNDRYGHYQARRIEPDRRRDDRR